MDGITPNPEVIGPMIYRQMGAVMAEVTAIGKAGWNEKQKFKFRGIDQVYNAINPLLAKHHIFMTAEVLDKTREERQSNSGGVLAFTCIHMRYHFNTEDGSSVSTDAYGEGMDSGDKSSNKAMAVAHKYALLQAFCIPTEDAVDPDADSPELAVAERPSAAEQQAEPDPQEKWANSFIDWLNKQDSMVEIEKVWKGETAKMRKLTPQQLKPLEAAYGRAKTRLTGMSAPKDQNAPINLDDEIRW